MQKSPYFIGLFIFYKLKKHMVFYKKSVAYIKLLTNQVIFSVELCFVQNTQKNTIYCIGGESVDTRCCVVLF